MTTETKEELVNFAIAVKQFCILVAQELPRFEGMAKAVASSAEDLRSCLQKEPEGWPTTPNDQVGDNVGINFSLEELRRQKGEI